MSLGPSGTAMVGEKLPTTTRWMAELYRRLIYGRRWSVGWSIYESCVCGTQHTLAVGRAGTVCRHKLRTHVLVMSRREVFREIIGQVCVSRFPEDVEVALVYSVTDPIVPHVDCLGAALFDGVVGQANGAEVVDLYGCGALGMSHFGKCGPEGFGILGVVKDGSKFCFCGGGDDVA